MNKTDLRTIFLEKRRGVSSSEIAELSQCIADRFFTEFQPSALNAVHCFISIPRLREVDTSLIYKRLWEECPGIITAAPRIGQARTELESVGFDPRTVLIENRWGILEPAGTTLVDPDVFDAVLVPLLCYDGNGDRVGYGKGYYDKFLSNCRPDCKKIGLSFFEPVDRINDADAHDVRLNYCLTPQKIYSFAADQL